jgi:hypothetical protein
MPNELFRQVVDDTGTRYEPVESLPDDLIYADPRYRQVVEESIGRRKTIKELSAELDEAKKAAQAIPAPEPTPVPAPAPTAPEPVKVLTADELYEDFKKRQAAEQAQANQVSTELRALATEHGLDESYLPILENAKDPKLVASELGRKKLSFAQGGVNAQNTPDPSTLFTRINGDLGLK